ncbi:MAG: thiolase family protein [Planctomycetota bacterium]
MVDVVVVAGVRTPFVRAGTDLKEVPAWVLGAAASRETLARSGVPSSAVEDVVFGCVAQPSDSANIARVVALRAGVPRQVPAVTVGRNCASGLEAVSVAAERIRSGRADVVLTGGLESMSRVPLEYPLKFNWKVASLTRARSWREKIAAASSMRLSDFRPVVALERGLSDPFTGEIMGRTAERLAREFSISREEQDEYALESHRRAVAHEESLRSEIQPFGVPPRFLDFVREDQGPRANQSIAALAKLRPYFDRKFGTVTVGNSCGITDGAVALLLAREDRARAEGWPILGRIKGHAFRGCDPERMGLGPVHATPFALKEAGIALQDIDRIELNEAFAAQVLACQRAFESDRFGKELGLPGAVGEIDPTKLNVRGGAIALGHPVGATGARLVLTLCDQLRELGGGFGLATLCIGGGQGGALVVEGVSA